MTTEMTTHEALTRLAAATGAAVARALEAIVPDGVVRGDVTVIPDASSPFQNLPIGGVAASVRYVDGVTGANVFVMPAESARTLATAMGVPAEDGNAELSELELSAIGEAANQMLAAASSAISVILGQQISISPPDVTPLDGTPDTSELWGTAPHACTTSFTVGGAPCRLIQLVPSAFVVRVARAFDEQGTDSSEDMSPSGTADGGDGIALDDSLSAISLRLWAELGRRRLSLASVLSLPNGAVIELDEAADNPVELYVNGLRFGTARLLVTDDGEWAVEVLSLGAPDAHGSQAAAAAVHAGADESAALSSVVAETAEAQAAANETVDIDVGPDAGSLTASAVAADN